jgi:nucleotide-binding universal stress UspA family protein
MSGYQRILCVTDLSEPSLRALEAAQQMAERFSAELIVLHVVDQLPVSPSDKTKIAQPSVEVAPTGQIPFNVTQHLEELMKGAEKTMDRVVGDTTTEQEQVRLEVREGFPPVEIVKAVGEMGVDLIVMAAQSQEKPERHRAGSITQQVVRDAPVSVLTVR